MADGWAALGAALGGDSEKAYQEGRALGARTEEALATARAKVDEAKAKMETEEALVANGVPRSQAKAMSTVFRGGGNIGDLGQAMLRNQEFDFRTRMGSEDPNVTPAARNRAAMGVASGPVEQNYNVGSRAYANKFNDEGPQPLGDAMSGGSGGEAAAIQLMRAFGAIAPDGQIADINGDGQRDATDKRLAFDIARTTGQVVEGGGGVRYPVDFNPFGGGPKMPGALPAPPAAASTATTTAVVAPPSAAAPPVVGSVVPPSTVMQNVADAEVAKKIGAARGEAAANMPQSMARLRNQTESADMVVDKLDQAMKDVNWLNTGIAGWATRGIPGTPAFALNNLLDTVKANVGFQGLQQMRYESPTGGALGQVAVRELEFLQAAWGNLNTAQDPRDLVQAMQSVRQHYLNFKKAAADDFAAAQQMAGGGVPSGASAAPAMQTPVAIKTDAEYDALPSGTEFIAPDGNRRRKP